MATIRNVLVATFGGSKTIRTAPLYQYDYGQIMVIRGVNLPEAYEVHFSNQEEGGTAETSVGDAEGVIIPDKYLVSGKDIYAWLFLHTGIEDGETEYKITIPVKKRPKTENGYTPEQQDLISNAIAVLNQAVEQTGESVTEAEGYANDAKAYSEAAEASASQASASEVNSLAYAQRAEQGASQAVTVAGSAQAYAQAASLSAVNAHQSEVNAEISADRAEQAATTAGYMDVEIVNGRLIYTKTDAVDVDFKLEAGHLIMEV